MKISEFLKIGIVKEAYDLLYADNLEAIKRNGNDLKYVEFQIPTICLEAVKQDGRALQYVKEQSPEICLEAVKQAGYALRFVIEQTPEICLAAVKQNGCALQYVKEQSPEICLEAVKQNGYALQYVEEQNPEICLAAVRENWECLKFVEDQTLEICLEAIALDKHAMQYVNYGIFDSDINNHKGNIIEEKIKQTCQVNIINDIVKNKMIYINMRKSRFDALPYFKVLEAISNKIDVIHTYCTEFFNWDTYFLNGYDVTVYRDDEHTEFQPIILSELLDPIKSKKYTDKEIRKEHNVCKMLLSEAFK
jgi:hypothetical protein